MTALVHVTLNLEDKILWTYFKLRKKENMRFQKKCVCQILGTIRHTKEERFCLHKRNEYKNDSYRNFTIFWLHVPLLLYEKFITYIHNITIYILYWLSGRDTKVNIYTGVRFLNRAAMLKVFMLIWQNSLFDGLPENIFFICHILTVNLW